MGLGWRDWACKHEQYSEIIILCVLLSQDESGAEESNDGCHHGGTYRMPSHGGSGWVRESCCDQGN